MIFKFTNYITTYDVYSVNDRFEGLIHSNVFITVQCIIQYDMRAVSGGFNDIYSHLIRYIK